MFTIEGKYTKALITLDGIEDSTLKQIFSMASHPAATNPIAIMPDCHVGKGCCIGFTMNSFKISQSHPDGVGASMRSLVYKDAAVIEEAIKPTARILFKLKPIYNVKAGGE